MCVRVWTQFDFAAWRAGTHFLGAPSTSSSGTANADTIGETDDDDDDDDDDGFESKPDNLVAPGMSHLEHELVEMFEGEAPRDAARSRVRRRVLGLKRIKASFGTPIGKGRREKGNESMGRNKRELLILAVHLAAGPKEYPDKKGRTIVRDYGERTMGGARGRGGAYRRRRIDERVCSPAGVART
jgi:hypothetical protein